jgi:hypothetical protein
MSATRIAVTTLVRGQNLYRHSYSQLSCLFFAAFLFLAPSRVSAAVSITVTPSTLNLPAAGTQQFTAVVTGLSDTTVIWTIQEGPSGGSVTNSGLYTAPGVVGTYHVVATSHADNSQSATATVVVPGFMTTGLLISRVGDTATVLPGGKVLYAGGRIPDGNNTRLDTAELYDPGTDSSIFTPNMTTARSSHTATLLPNGKVLLVGGDTMPSGQTASAELFDPLSGTFAATGSMSAPRSGHTATLLSNGKVLIAGGVNCPITCSTYSSAELYDPSTGTFSPTGNLTVPRNGHTATLLTSGRVLIAGGTTDGTNAIVNAELYDPSTGQFIQTSAMVNPRQFFTATLLNSGRVLFAGGLVGGAVTSTAEIYDPSPGTFSQTGSLNTQRDFHTATLLPSGKVLIARGISTYTLAATAELFDPVLGTFSNTGDLLEPGYYGNATLLPNGTVLISGWGKTMQFYDPAAGVFTSHGVFMKVSREEHTATLLTDGRILFVGGYDANGNMNSSAEIYDPSTRKIALTGSLATARHGHSATLLGNGKVLVVGGFSDISDIFLISTAELYDPASGTFGPTGSTNTPRAFHTATLLPNGKVLIAGGLFPSPQLYKVADSSAELYDSNAGTFTPTGSMTAPRFLHTATLLNDGRVLIAEGVAVPPAVPLISATADELYDSITSSFSPLGTSTLWGANYSTSLAAFDSVLLASGQVLVDVGTIFDPTSSTLSAVDFRSIQYPGIGNYEFTLLPNSQVFVVGGTVNARGNNAYLFDPPSRTYVVAGNTEFSRSSPTAMLLSNGEVLIAGGASEKEIEFYLPPGDAPAPSISSVSPNPVTGFTPALITVQGANFTTGSVVWMNGAILPTTIVSITELTTTIPAQVMAFPGNNTIVVKNAIGVFSAPFTVTVDNPRLWTNLSSGSSVFFGAAPVQTTVSQFVGIQNQGNVPLTFDSVSISGTNSADFIFDTTKTTCPLPSGTIQPSIYCQIYINFTPHTAGARSATLTVAYTAPPGGPLVLSLTGNAFDDPVISITPASLSFGNQVVGSVSAPQSLMISNIGTVVSNPLSPTLSYNANYSLTNNCPSNLAPGGSCSMAITFNPNSIGSLPGSVTISGDSVIGPLLGPHVIQFTGTGTDFVIAPVTGTTGSATVAAGKPAVYQLSVSPQVFTGAVTMGCVETTMVPNTTCTVSPNPAMLNGTTATPVTVTVTTMARSGVAAPGQTKRFLHPRAFDARTMRLLSYMLLLLSLSMVLARGLKGTRLALTTVFLFALLAAGCGSVASGGGSTPPSGSAGTPAGMYSLLVTASSSGVTRTMMLSLTVQ